MREAERCASSVSCSPSIAILSDTAAQSVVDAERALEQSCIDVARSETEWARRPSELPKHAMSGAVVRQYPWTTTTIMRSLQSDKRPYRRS